jgi:hypothetical protein
MLKAIETQYKGYRFRSRLEARWAVFFDALGVKWEYEKEGYDLGEAGWYLPDFYLADFDHWIEIKPEEPMTSEDSAKHEAFKRVLGKDCLFILRGLPVTFRGDDRAKRFDSHLNQMITFAILSTHGFTIKSTKLEEFPGFRWNIKDLRRASTASRSARFEHGETPEATQ